VRRKQAVHHGRAGLDHGPQLMPVDKLGDGGPLCPTSCAICSTGMLARVLAALRAAPPEEGPMANRLPCPREQSNVVGEARHR
jgi:hypothetical protein